MMDLMLRRYPDTAYIMSMDAETMLPIIMAAEKREEKDRIREEWLELLPVMNCGIIEYMSLEAYERRRTGADIDRRSNAEILADVDAIEAKFEKEKEGSE